MFSASHDGDWRLLLWYYLLLLSRVVAPDWAVDGDGLHIRYHPARSLLQKRHVAVSMTKEEGLGYTMTIICCRLCYSVQRHFFDNLSAVAITTMYPWATDYSVQWILEFITHQTVRESTTSRSFSLGNNFDNLLFNAASSISYCFVAMTSMSHRATITQHPGGIPSA